MKMAAIKSIILDGETTLDVYDESKIENSLLNEAALHANNVLEIEIKGGQISAVTMDREQIISLIRALQRIIREMMVFSPRASNTNYAFPQKQFVFGVRYSPFCADNPQDIFAVGFRYSEDAIVSVRLKSGIGNIAINMNPGTGLSSANFCFYYSEIDAGRAEAGKMEYFCSINILKVQQNSGDAKIKHR
jgi:hypothetical protein